MIGFADKISGSSLAGSGRNNLPLMNDYAPNRELSPVKGLSCFGQRRFHEERMVHDSDILQFQFPGLSFIRMDGGTGSVR